MEATLVRGDARVQCRVEREVKVGKFENEKLDLKVHGASKKTIENQMQTEVAEQKVND